MNFKKKKELIARTLNVGKDRILLNKNMEEELKEAITRQDIRDLIKEGAIKIKDKKGRRKNIKRSGRKGAGKIKKRIKKRKKEYMILVRKLREYTKNLKDSGKITKEKHKKTRTEIRSKKYRSLGHLKESLEEK